MELFDKFIKVITAFEREGVEYIIIGGFAVVLQGFPRLTQDIDMFIRPTEENIFREVDRIDLQYLREKLRRRDNNDD